MKRSMNKFSPLTIIALIIIGNNLTSSIQYSPLHIYVDRKEILEKCTRGYLLTKLHTENRPKVACYVLELRTDNNAPYVSSIPAGTYPVKIRIDGTLGWRLELQNVPNRENVQIHVGNFPRNTVGCLLPGKNARPNECAVLNSAEAMNELRTRFAVFGNSGETEITIRDIN
jgi:hypothetical protein